MLGQTIGNWTPAELQAFLQNVVRLEPSALPAALQANSAEAALMRVTEQLDFDSAAKLSKQGVLFDPLSFLGTGFTGSAEALHAETTGSAFWRASGGSILAQNFDLPDGGDQYTAANDTTIASTLYLPSQAEVNNLHVYTSEIPSSISTSNMRITLEQLIDGEWNEVDHVIAIGSDISGSLGFKTYALPSGHVLEGGIYAVLLYTNWTSKTGNLGFASITAARTAQNAGQLGGVARAFTQSGAVTSDPWTPGSVSIDRIWVGLS